MSDLKLIILFVVGIVCLCVCFYAGYLFYDLNLDFESLIFYLLNL